MVFGYIRLFKNLTLIQHVVILLTTFVIPMSFELLQGLNDTGLCLPCVSAGELALYFMWYQIAMLVIAWSTREDRTRVEATFTQISSELIDRIQLLGEEHKREIAGIQDRAGDLEEWVSKLRQAIEEELETKLPGRRHSVRLAPVSYEMSVSIGEVSIRPSPYILVRLRSWVKRRALRFWRWSRKWVWDLNYE